MIKVIGVRFRTAGKIYFFDPLDFEIKRNDHVIVETARGIEYGTVVGDPRLVADDEIIQPLKPVIRIANERDQEQERLNKSKEKEAFQICLEKIQKHGLEMKLIDAEYTFDNNKVLFYFTADGRIDFRELVKDLASIFRTRIELRQIGVRDETKLLGGIGICGRPLCCHTHLSEFVPVSIKMAKEQNLSLNPTKISGVCGRLMCCLKHEEETYEELNRKLPNVGDTVTTVEGFQGEVHSVSVLRQLVKVVVEIGDEKEIREYHVDDLKFKKHYRKENMNLTPEELRELQKLERDEQLDADIEAQQNRKEHRNNNKRDNNRENTRVENRENNRENTRGENRENNRENTRVENRENNRENTRGENRENNRENTRGENRENNHGENRENTRRENRENNRENAGDNVRERGNDNGRDRGYRPQNADNKSQGQESEQENTQRDGKKEFRGRNNNRGPRRDHRRDGRKNDSRAEGK